VLEAEMQNVPKIVRQRLRAAAPAVSHPDAEALTAFAEHSLPEIERDVVLEHLARCGDCRDIVALALPAVVPNLVELSIKPSRTEWLTWPALRWAFVAAGVVIIASVGILRYQARFQPTTASNTAPAPQPATTEAKNQTLAAPAPPPPAEKRDKIEAGAGAVAPSDVNNSVVSDKKSAPRIDVPTVNAVQSQVGGVAGGVSRAVHGTLPHGPMLANQYSANQWQQNRVQNQAAAPAPTAKQYAPAPSANPQVDQAVEASGAAEVTTQAQNADSNLLMVQPTPQEPSVLKAKPLPQPAPGQIGGHVVDPSGAVVSNARITVIPAKTAGITKTVTDSQGAWLIAGLPTGNYKVQAEAPGFTTAVLDLHYDANQPSMYSFTLRPGSVSETVEVSAQNMQVQADTASPSDTITSREVSQVAINGRNYTQLATLSPGGSQTFWSLNRSGGLQRSFDQGKTWQAVDVNANSPALASESVAVAAQTSRARAKDLDKARKGAAAFAFRALAVAGSDVWVGGSGGALYHSADGGSHWTRVVPGASGTVVTGDVVSLEFSDPEHGKLSTSAAEVWTTADAGQTWQKQ
jgi:hypothetical protein